MADMAYDLNFMVHLVVKVAGLPTLLLLPLSGLLRLPRDLFPMSLSTTMQGAVKSQQCDLWLSWLSWLMLRRFTGCTPDN